MEHQQNPPVIARLDALDRQIRVLEEKRSDFCAVESENECKTLSLALEEVQQKGTLMERLAILEKRVLELSLEIDEGNTSRSSCSTVQDSEMNGKKDFQVFVGTRKDDKGDAIATQPMEEPSTIKAQERGIPSVDRIVKETPSHRSRRQKKKSHKKWPWLFLHTC